MPSAPSAPARSRDEAPPPRRSRSSTSACATLLQPSPMAPPAFATWRESYRRGRGSPGGLVSASGIDTIRRRARFMAEDRGEGTRRVRIDDLRRCLALAFQRLGLAPREAEDLGGLLVDSELRGHAGHGVAALAVLASLYRDGTLNPRPRVRVLRETDGALLLDGDHGCGPGAPTWAMRWCVERARERKGIAVATVRDWQLVVAGPYARLAAEAGLIGFACTNFVPLVAPPGGRTAVLGSNPVAYGLPAQHHHPVVLDIATTVASMQEVRIAAREGAAVPEGILLDRDGRPTTDPGELFEGGSLAPLGSPQAAHKGFGLALLVDALAGVLSGARFAQGSAPVQPGASSGPSTW